MANVLATFAQFERRLIGQRTREALAAKRAAGVRLGRPLSLPAPVRQRITADREAGRSLAAIARESSTPSMYRPLRAVVSGGRRPFALLCGLFDEV